MKRNDVLKIIAMVTMLIDHLGHMFKVELTPIFRDFSMSVFNDPLALQPDILRIIGRLSFPIFAYMIAMGWTHTRSKTQYIKRLAIFGLISQVPYAYFNPELEANFLHLNVIILFTFSLGALWLIDEIKKNKNYLLLLVLLGYVLLPLAYEYYGTNTQFSYSTYGVLMVMLFYVFKHPLTIIASYLLLTLFYNTVSVPLAWFKYYGMKEVLEYFQGYKNLVEHVFKTSSQQYSVYTLPIILILSRFEFKISLNKWVGYLFYPGHMAILILIKIYM